MNKVLVSIILPVYNVGKYLSVCLDSVISQTYANIEIILIDDGSTDDSGKILDSYAQKDERIRVVHKKNEGVSATRNFGIEIATGDYICFADSDDLLEPDYVEYLLNLCIQYHAEVSLTTYMYTTFYDTPQVTHDNVKVLSGIEAARQILYYHIPIGCYCKMFKREFLQLNSLRFNSDIYIGEGFNFNVSAFQLAKSVVVGHRKIYRYRRDNMSSAMTSFSIDKAKMALSAIDMIKMNLIDNSVETIKACKYAEWHTCDDMYNWMVLANVKNIYIDFYDKCYRTICSYSWDALKAPVNKKEKYRALICSIHPRLMAFQLQLRKFIFT